MFLSFEPEFSTNFDYFNIYERFEISCSAELSLKKSFITSGPGQYSNVMQIYF